jgi:pyroglutamyl-peptidase
LLITGFGGFPGHAVNPSQQVAELLRRERRRDFARKGVELSVAILPVEHEALSPLLHQLFTRERPDAVVHLGVAARRTSLGVETVARNCVSTLRPDAAKKLAWSRSIVHGGPALLRSPAAAARLAALSRRSGVAAAPSRDAGDYICNEALYLSLLMDRRAMFIHMPDWRGDGLRQAADSIARMAAAFTLDHLCNGTGGI